MENKKAYTKPEFSVDELNSNDIVLISIFDLDGALGTLNYNTPDPGIKY